MHLAHIARSIFSPAQSFLTPQPKGTQELKPAAFLIKHILHDWSYQYCRVILKHLRDAAGRNGETRLLVIDYVVSYACRISGESDDKDGDLTARRSIPGVYQDLAQPPLLANWGAASAFPYFADLVVSSSHITHSSVSPMVCAQHTNSPFG